MRPVVLSIAGFDPSGGAGILADIKTFEQHKVLGLGVNTCNTIQTEDEFIGLEWVKKQNILDQILALSNRYELSHVKVGLIQNLEFISEIVDLIKSRRKDVTIVWDPVISASSGFTFHADFDKSLLKKVLSKIYMVTPNVLEYSVINEVLSDCPSNLCSTLLKGGHKEEKKGMDILLEKDQKMIFDSRSSEFSKHGTGCVFSAAILANLARGKDVIMSIKLAKEYIFSFIESNRTLLGYHSAEDEK